MEGKDTNERLEEYRALRSEIEQKMQLINTLTLGMVTAVTACIGFGFEFKNSYIFIAGIIFIVPISQRILYYSQGIERIGSYIEIFLEGDSDFHWETRNQRLEKYSNSYISNCYLKSLTAVFLYMASVISWIVLEISIHKKIITVSKSNVSISLANLFYLGIVILLGIIIIGQTFSHKKHYRDVRKEYDWKWKSVKNDEEKYKDV